MQKVETGARKTSSSGSQSGGRAPHGQHLHFYVHFFSACMFNDGSSLVWSLAILLCTKGGAAEIV